MPLLFLIALFAVPYLEFLVFVEVADEIGGLSALALTLFTAVLGIYIIRQEGIQVLRNLKNTVDRGESPVSELTAGQDPPSQAESLLTVNLKKKTKNSHHKNSFPLTMRTKIKKLDCASKKKLS